jgi:hypothetical protein
MTSVRPRLFAAVPLLAVGLGVFTTSALASLPDSCNGKVDVAVGSPKAAVGGQAGAGSVTIVFEPDGASPALGNAADVTLTEADLGGTAVAGDGFGTSVVTGYENSTLGCSMVAVGAPGADGGAGRVYVFVLDEDGFIGTPAVITQDTSSVPDTAEAGDGFGSSLLFGGDLFVSWLAVGSPGEDLGAATDSGMVHVLPYTGDASTWGAGSVAYSQGTAPVPGASETGDHFGAALGLGRNVWSLWVGIPDEDIGTIKDAGALVSLPGSHDYNADTTKLPGTIGSVAALTQDSTGVPGTAEKYDRFGSVLTGIPGIQSQDREPVIGVPGEDVGSLKDAGVIEIAYQDRTWAAYQQGAGGFSSTPEAGDRFGASLSVFNTTLLVGVPGEDIGTVVDAGVVHFVNATGLTPKLSASSEQMWSQSSTDVLGSAEAGDLFGAALANGVDGAVIGVPGEDVGAVVDAGSLNFLPYRSAAPTMGLTATGNLAFVAGNPGFPGAVETGAALGASAYSVSQ